MSVEILHFAFSIKKILLMSSFPGKIESFCEKGGIHLDTSSFDTYAVALRKMTFL